MDMEKREPSYAVARNVKCAATMKNSMETPQKIKTRTNHFWVFIQRKQKHKVEKIYAPLRSSQHLQK